MSLHQEFKTVSLHLQYDTLTVYPMFNHGGPDYSIYIGPPSFADGSDKRLYYQVLQVNEAIKELGILQSSKNIPIHENFIDPKEAIHGLYHDKGMVENESHIHNKFINKVTVDQLETILIPYQKEKLLSQGESQEFIQRYRDREVSFLKALDTSLPEIKSTNTSRKYEHRAAIIKFISKCDQNDLLENLHKHLLSEKFDYLRAITGKTSISFWQGTNANGEIVKTSGTWASIEKAISLQMSVNVANNCKFNSKIAVSRAKQFSNDSTFFSIKRNKKSFYSSTSSSYDAFLNGNTKKLNKMHRSHFSPYIKKT